MSFQPLVPRSPRGNPLRGEPGSARRWIWERRGYTGTVKVFWCLRSHPDAWSHLEWRWSPDRRYPAGKMYAALVRREGT